VTEPTPTPEFTVVGYLPVTPPEEREVPEEHYVIDAGRIVAIAGKVRLE